ncbi:NUDIX domain-containing protein [Tsuneonella sp. CC-YZS046]|uniref:NUDIX domain-containing protein n=1 Tax=Tsuneonella sp. CC-YZS046 TaxID=3042152 RepID=UPI002D76D351|nr:NUDIX domain-containing protein [Tsuneonella sp. CC-YZS046]WRO67035.1 NUDIX domain-containing protein [Tsuneonella sp. CC-YZS046]
MTEPEEVDPATAIPAATVVIFRNARSGGLPELLMVTRSAAMAFAGGAAVFPGGRIDDADRELAASLGHGGDQDDLSARVAAIRETLEETGLVIGLDGIVDAAIAAQARALLLDKGELAPVLAHFGWKLAPQSLTPFARWRPNMKHARTFDTRFYLANLGTGEVDIAIDATENTRLFWISAQEALARADRGEMRVIYPTRRNLERLAQFRSFAEAQDHALAIPPDIIVPFLDRSGPTTLLCIPEDRGYPITAEPFETADRA